LLGEKFLHFPFCLLFLCVLVNYLAKLLCPFHYSLVFLSGEKANVCLLLAQILSRVNNFSPRFSLCAVKISHSLVADSETCSTPPTTPLDELALKRHRFFADLIDAAQAAVEHRVRFDPLGPLVTEVDDCETPKNSNLNFFSFAVDCMNTRKKSSWHFKLDV
jgi:hypothetical protein